MQYCWRITKYDPKKRNAQGIFSGKEWTAYTDIGKPYGNKNLDYGEYLKIENAYVDAVTLLMMCSEISSLRVCDLEKRDLSAFDANMNDAMISLFNAIKEGHWLMQIQVENCSRLILREQLWCKLINSEKMYIHFGYDYYMYVGSSLKCEKTINRIQESGLFVELFTSPYS